uniref:Pentatricopeptide repeat-containing protein n=1 Tax=Rhizophora mucronata TaxID=61149 RepID=A0A2P2PJ40_RHIMU
MISGLAVNGQCKNALDIFDRMCLEGTMPDDVTFISILSACTHGGLVDEGRGVFDQMMKKYGIKPRIEHYGCMVDMLGRAGKLNEAIQFIQSMGLEPNAVIWATLLASCKIHGNGELLESVTRKILHEEPLNHSYLTLISNTRAFIGHWEDSSSFWSAMRQQEMEKVPGCSLIQIGNRVHEFMAKDTRHVQSKEIYGALCGLNGQLRQVCGSQ